MRIPDSLVSLLHQGIIDEVIRPLKSGKEAQVFLVHSSGQARVAKIYKDAQNRSFQNRAEYQEGRKVRSSRDQRAMDKGSRYGRAQQEEEWKSAEVDTIYRLKEAGVRVPEPFHYVDGVLIMQLVVDAHGNPAPRLGDLAFTREASLDIHRQLLREVVRMLCADIVHGDLSDFNVLMAHDGPVIIDFPQSVKAPRNQNAKKLLLRDVANLHRFASRFSPGLRPLPYAEEMWQLYERGELTPTTKLTGMYQAPKGSSNANAVMRVIADARDDERQRREKRGLSMRGLSALPAKGPQPAARPDRPRGPETPASPTGPRRRRRRRRS